MNFYKDSVMQRLILFFVTGDGYTYSCENHVPFIYESKQKALSDLEDLLLEALEKEQELQKLRLSHGEIYRKLAGKIQACKKEKELEVLRQQLRAHQEQFPGYPVYEEINFGGAILQLDYFFEKNEDGIFLNMPQIYTMDEFWAEAETRMTQKI